MPKPEEPLMSLDTPPPPNPPADAAPQRTLWSTLTRWWLPAVTGVEPAIGYESAQPWTLGEDTPAEPGDNPRY
jgi:hypothetical protein